MAPYDRFASTLPHVILPGSVGLSVLMAKHHCNAEPDKITWALYQGATEGQL